MNIVFIGCSSMGPRYIMGLLKRHGHSCHGIYQGIDYLIGERQASGFNPPLSLDELESLNPDIVGFSACTFDFEDQLVMAMAVKKRLPSILIYFGGVHPSILPEEVIKHHAVDILCCGEGEYPSLELCQKIEAGKDITSIPNLWIKQGGEVFRNLPRNWIQDLDSLDMDREGLSYLGIFTGRGCTGDCYFCNAPVLKRIGARGKFFRKRSVKKVLDEIDWIVTRDPAFCRLAHQANGNLDLQPTIRIKDDTFLADKAWFLEFAQRFSQSFPQLQYICQARADEIDEEVTHHLADSGCRMISMGIECGDDKMRIEVLNKSVTSEQIRRAIQLVRNTGIEVLGQWVIGFPGETIEQMIKTLKLHLELEDIPQVHIATPFPKTRMHKMAIDMGHISESFRPTTSLYDDFIFHKGSEKNVLRMIYNMFPVASLAVPEDLRDISFNERGEIYKGHNTVGNILLHGIIE